MGEETLDIIHGYGREIYDYLRLKTFPIAIKMLEEEKDIPEGAVRPKRDLGYHLAACQGFAMSRREGTLLAMLKEDMWCHEAVVGFGFGEPPQFWLDGHTRFPETVKSLEVGSKWAQEFPRFEPNRYIGVASAPLATANFVPDVVVIYCDSVQLGRLCAAKVWKDGRGIACNIMNFGVCVQMIVPVMQENRCKIALPCTGDRAYAMCQDDEMVFSAPIKELGNLVEGIRYHSRYNFRVPTLFSMRPEYPMKESYFKAGKMLGMDLDKAEIREPANRSI